MGDQAGAFGAGVLHELQLLEHPRPVGLGTVEQDKIHLAVVVDGEAFHPRHLLLPVAEIRHQPVDALAGLADHLAYAQQFTGVGIGAGHHFAIARGVQLGA